MRTPTALAALCLMTFALAGAQDERPTKFAPAFDPAGLDMVAGMRAQEASTTRTERHEMLEYFVGDWDIELDLAEGGPIGDVPPTKGSATFELILGGRFLQGTGPLNFPGMGEVDTMTLVGFDVFANRYDLTLMNAMSTTTLRATGLSTQDGSAIHFYGPMDEALLNFHGRTVRYAWRVIDEDTFVIEVDDLAIGNPEQERVFSMTYSRK